MTPQPTMTTADGVHLAVRCRCAGDAPRAAVVVVHGFSASAACSNVESLAEVLYADGLDVVTYDARGHGSSEGESTLGDHEHHDVAAAVRCARERTPHVVLVGASMGAVAALRYAVSDPALVGVVSVSCPAQWRLPRNLRGVLAASMTRTPLGRRLTARLTGVRIAARWTDPEPPLSLVSRLEVPAVFVHGTNDRFISMRDAELLHNAANSARRLVIVKGMGHAFAPVADVPVQEAVAWTLSQPARVTR